MTEAVLEKDHLVEMNIKKEEGREGQQMKNTKIKCKTLKKNNKINLPKKHKRTRLNKKIIFNILSLSNIVNLILKHNMKLFLYFG